MAAKSAAKGHASKHAGSKKHAKGHRKHHPAHQAMVHGGVMGGGSAGPVSTKAHHAKPAKARGLAVGDLLPVCSLEAVAMSLRLAGQGVTDDEVAWLWESAGSPDEGVSIADALVAFGLVPAACQSGVEPATLPRRLAAAVPGRPGRALILGVDDPAPHAVLATADGWWSWGELYSPWTTAVSEAWMVTCG